MIKKRKLSSLCVVAVVLFLMTQSCRTMTASINTTQPIKFEGYRNVKKIAILPAVSDNTTVAEVMNQINYQTTQPARNQGYTIIGVDEIQNYLGKEYKELTKDPTNEVLVNKIVEKFGVEAVLYCRVNGWKSAIKSGDAYRSQVSLSYSLIDARTLKTLSKISGDAYDVTILPDRGYIQQLSLKLADRLVGAL